jgi:hemerythrin-like domain-containing protein
MPHFEHPPLERHPALQPLSRDHYTGLVHAQHLIKAAEGDPAARRQAVSELLDAWATEISEHFADEERLLLPLLDPTDADRLTDEHQTLRQIAEQARQQRRRTDPDADWLRQAGQRLRDHIRWEERELFPRVEARADAATLKQLEARTRDIEAARPRNTCREP